MPNTGTTLYENFYQGLQLSQGGNCLGTRQKDGHYTWITYQQVADQATRVGSGLLQLVQEYPSIKNSGSTHRKLNQWHVGIYSVNRKEWIITDLGACSYSLVSVALYDTLGDDTLEFTVNHAELGVVVCSADKVASLLKVASKCPVLKVIVSMDVLQDPLMKVLKDWASSLNVRLMDFEELMQLGHKNLQPHIKPQAEDLCTICYTSGTTGNPKGAMLMHKNFVSSGMSVSNHEIEFNKDEIHISYLPLAHCFERVLVTSILGNGASIGFYRGDVLTLIEDVQALKPTFFPSVPRLFNRIYAKLIEGTIRAPGVRGWLFRKAMADKIALLKDDKQISKESRWDWTLFSKVTQVLGGRVKLMITGSAPIGGDVLTFLRAVFCCDILEGYGQTECAAGSTLTFPGDYSTNLVGAPLSCNEFKLVDVPDMGYSSQDKPSPRGEVWIRGHNVMLGYYKDEQKTKETITSDGWLQTGDIGLVTPTGTLAIIDRKKNIFKLAQGEYVAAEKLEVVFGSGSDCIAQVFVHGDSLQSELVAVVVPEQEKLVVWANKKGIKHANYKELCSTKQVRDYLTQELARIGKFRKLAGFEIPKAVHVEYDLWSVENDLLTPSFKLKRNIAVKKYRDVIDKLYGELAEKKSQTGETKSLL